MAELQSDAEGESSSDPEGEYRVKAIIAKRVRQGVCEYLIEWEGYSSGDNTWEPVEHLEGAPKLLAAFEKSHKQGARASGKRERPATSGTAVPPKKRRRKPKEAPLLPLSDGPRQNEGAGSLPARKGNGGSSSKQRVHGSRMAREAQSSQGIRPTARASSSAASELRPPSGQTGGIALPPGWRFKQNRQGEGSEGMWTDAKGNPFRTVEAATAAVARWQQRQADRSTRVDSKAKPSHPLPLPTGASLAGGSGGAAGDVRCTFCSQRITAVDGGASAWGTLRTAAEGDPVCRRCCGALFDGVSVTCGGVLQLDVVMARLGLRVWGAREHGDRAGVSAEGSHSNTVGSAAHAETAASGKPTPSGGAGAATSGAAQSQGLAAKLEKSQKSSILHRWERADRRTTAEVSAVLSQVIQRIEQTAAAAERRKKKKPNTVRATPIPMPSSAVVLLPDDAYPGQQLRFRMANTENFFAFTVPPGVSGGIRLTVAIPRNSAPAPVPCPPISPAKSAPPPVPRPPISPANSQNSIALMESRMKCRREEECSKVEGKAWQEEQVRRKREKEVQKVVSRLISDVEKAREKELKQEAKHALFAARDRERQRQRLMDREKQIELQRQRERQMELQRQTERQKQRELVRQEIAKRDQDRRQQLAEGPKVMNMVRVEVSRQEAQRDQFEAVQRQLREEEAREQKELKLLPQPSRDCQEGRALERGENRGEGRMQDNEESQREKEHLEFQQRVWQRYQEQLLLERIQVVNKRMLELQARPAHSHSAQLQTFHLQKARLEQEKQIWIHADVQMASPKQRSAPLPPPSETPGQLSSSQPCPPA